MITQRNSSLLLPSVAFFFTTKLCALDEIKMIYSFTVVTFDFWIRASARLRGTSCLSLSFAGAAARCA